MAEISIVVPVYKVEAYLPQCIDSILSQSYQDFELILVDDGSPDCCGALCEDYAKKDSRIVVIHKENGGLSSARNAGIEVATGKYITFIDSDDFIAQDMIEILYHNLVQYEADVSVCSFYKELEGKTTPAIADQQFLVVDAHDAVRLVLEDQIIMMCAWGKLYRTGLFDTVRYPEGKLYEDAYTTPTILSMAKKVVITTEPKYYYCLRGDSITNCSFRQKDMEVIEAHLVNFRLVQDRFPDLKSYAEFRCLWSYFYVLQKMILSHSTDHVPEYDQVIRYLRKNCLAVFRNPHFTKQRKISILCLLFSKRLYHSLVWRKYHQNRKSLIEG